MSRAILFNKERQANALGLAKNGAPPESIAEILNIPFETINQFLIDNHINEETIPGSYAADKQQIILNRQLRLSTLDLSQRLEISQFVSEMIKDSNEIVRSALEKVKAFIDDCDPSDIKEARALVSIARDLQDLMSKAKSNVNASFDGQKIMETLRIVEIATHRETIIQGGNPDDLIQLNGDGSRQPEVIISEDSAKRTINLGVQPVGQ